MAAGGALAIDRDIFSKLITEKIKSHPNITVTERLVTEIPQGGVTVIATGPLTDDKLAEKLAGLCEGGNLSFYDARRAYCNGGKRGYEQGVFCLTL